MSVWTVKPSTTAAELTLLSTCSPRLWKYETFTIGYEIEDIHCTLAMICWKQSCSVQSLVLKLVRSPSKIYKHIHVAKVFTLSERYKTVWILFIITETNELVDKTGCKNFKPEKILITVQMCIRKDTSVGRGINLLILFCILFCILFPSLPLVWC